MACKDKNNLPVGVRLRRVWQYSGGTWVPDQTQHDILVPQGVFSYNPALSCMHCAEPACLRVCPTTAIYKREDGIVMINAQFCIGCRYCQWACPYGAPQFNEKTQVMVKCDLCQDLMVAGEQPPCVTICPQRALEVGELTDLQSKHGNLAMIEPMPSPNHTRPSIVITPHWHAQMCRGRTGNILE